MSDRGFKFLREKMKDLNFGGEVKDIEPNLERLMLLYREWAHYLFPEAKFSDFITKVRKECSSRNMKLYLTTLKSHQHQQQEYEAEGFSDIDFDDLVFDTKKEKDDQNQNGKTGHEDDDDDFLLDFYEEENSSDHGHQSMDDDEMNINGECMDGTNNDELS